LKPSIINRTNSLSILVEALPQKLAVPTVKNLSGAIFAMLEIIPVKSLDRLITCPRPPDSDVAVFRMTSAVHGKIVARNIELAYVRENLGIRKHLEVLK
jgi:hypothetical protein